MFVFSVIACYLWSIHGEFILVGKYKYPPQLYYLSYAVMCISLLWIVRAKITRCLQQIRLLNVVTYIGSHTLWIYFWHIPIVTFIGTHFTPSIRFMIVYFSAIVLSYIQTCIVNTLCNRISNEFWKKNFSR